MASPFGEIKPPIAVTGEHGEGLFLLINRIIQLTVAVAGLFMIIQIIMAGYLYITANGDPKKTEQAWAKIWQALLGFVIVASAFVIAAVIGTITGVNPLNIIIYGPGTN